MYTLKLIVCVLYDIFDFTIGRLMFATPLAGELLGVALCVALFGKSGIWYALEAIDFTEQFDGFVPTATIIALMCKPAVQTELDVIEHK